MVRRAQKDPHSTVARGDHERFVVNTKSSDEKAEHGVGVVDAVPQERWYRFIVEFSSRYLNNATRRR